MDGRTLSCILSCKFDTILRYIAVSPTTARRFSASTRVTIRIGDINDHVPRFTKRVYDATMSESYVAGVSIVSVSATDRDIGENAQLTYTLREADRVHFSMVTVGATNTGVLKVYTVRGSTLARPRRGAATDNTHSQSTQSGAARSHGPDGVQPQITHTRSLHGQEQHARTALTGCSHR